MNQIDLSSLEGPPIIHRPHSTNPYSEGNLPSIQLDYSALPLEPFNGMPSHPPRPASADPVPSCRDKSPSIGSGVNWLHRGRANVQRPANLVPENDARHGGSGRRIDYSSARRPNSHLGHFSPFNPHPEEARYPFGQSASPSNQLIWDDRRNIWVRADTAMPTPSYPTIANLSTRRSDTRQVPTLTHSRSTNTYFSNNSDRDADIASSPPPPYEQHRFDQPISSLRVSPGEHPSRTAAQDSMWAAVAGRRVHRVPFGN
ncbi:hypothetical protein BDV23DRAFT_182598 [Aspergillus alliaceus]|uniref:Uncharacterized protein n=1 Tax=Petromyces alliaceus TaxID=209559 RepID=A0A5N7CAZ8_PETAA|nr:uncharacterized protein BDW43DRAFT_308638 [Aspergillus alliaceus]KAB8236383.1 hypothetical protein BDW43DRAFT_308638 [Aspergillus alliaceus]KAE8391304.1 hypothetical protein BDV23DRAFT_182598 [Aspergillus alliaceus]